MKDTPKERGETATIRMYERLYSTFKIMDKGAAHKRLLYLQYKRIKRRRKDV
jgi:hypothetical protein